MSNFDHTIDDGLVEELKKGGVYAHYAGWNFCGYVYWNDTKFSCEVWVYNYHENTLHGETLQEIMNKVSEKYGHD